MKNFKELSPSTKFYSFSINKKDYEVIKKSASDEIKYLDNKLDGELQSAVSKLGPSGLLMSGLHAVAIKNCLIVHIDHLSKIYLDKLYLYQHQNNKSVIGDIVKDFLDNMLSEKIKKLSFKMADELKKINQYNDQLLQELDLNGETKSVLSKNIIEYIKNLNNLEALQVAKNSVKISIIAALVSIIALAINFY